MERLTTKLDDGNYIPTALCTTDRAGNVDDLDGCTEYCDGECSKCAIQKCFNKLAEYENSEEIFRDKMTDTACEFLSDKEEFGKWLDRNKWIAKKCDEYARAEEQGLLLRLPCKVGDTVYAYCSEFGILPYTVDCIVIDEHITYQCSSYSEPIGDCPSECLDEIEPDISDFGKTVFLTQEQADQKLKKVGGGRCIGSN